MSVRLVGITQGSGAGMELGPGELLAWCARVSSAANQGNHGTGPALLRSLVRRKEWSPFEMVSMTVEIVTTRDIARQILRHRSLSFQEFSQRYADVEDAPVFRPARDQHPTDRQSSLPVNDPVIQDDWARAQKRVWKTAMDAYKAARSRGMAKEVARALLPEGMTASRLFAAGTIRSWIHYVQLRTEEGTQKEHREIAADVKEILLGQFPKLADVI